MVDGFDRAIQLGPARARHWIDLRTPNTSDPRAHTQNRPGAQVTQDNRNLNHLQKPIMRWESTETRLNRLLNMAAKNGTGTGERTRATKRVVRFDIAAADAALGKQGLVGI